MDDKKNTPIKWERLKPFLKALTGKSWPWPVPEKWIGTDDRLTYKISADMPVIQSTTPFKKIVDKKYEMLRFEEGYNVETAFEKLKEQLTNEGINIKSYDWLNHYDPNRFNRAYNIRRKKRLRNK